MSAFMYRDDQSWSMSDYWQASPFILLNHGCWSAACAVLLRRGSECNSRSTRLRADSDTVSQHPPCNGTLQFAAIPNAWLCGKPSNGLCAAKIVNNVAPADHISAGIAYGLPRITSGADVDGEPTCSNKTWSFSNCAASPKSPSLKVATSRDVPRTSIWSTFSHFTSRCTMRFSWRCESAKQMCDITLAAASSGSPLLCTSR
mmetsp:Transcript_71231/g.112820  ORF Transcript_71231/g.112820 Transcript_71231/m.112820 type:complete len:202 (-) Transcript_71231:957-1562(-)